MPKIYVDLGDITNIQPRLISWERGGEEAMSRNSADICRENGWQVGDVLHNGLPAPDQIRITAIGEEHTLVRVVMEDGRPFSGKEISFRFGLDGWRKVEPTEAKP